MHEVLDDIKPRTNTSKMFTNLAFLTLICTSTLFYYSFTNYGLDSPNGRLPLYLSNSLDILSIVGMIFSVISFTKREVNSFRKWLSVGTRANN